MKTIVLLAGMTPDVTVLYYQQINSYIRAQLGARHSAPLYIYSVDLEKQLSRISAGDWAGLAEEYTNSVVPLTLPNPNTDKPSIDGVLMCAILAHKVSPQIQSALPESVPFLHVADFAASALKANKITKAGLIGPLPTMIDRNPNYFIGRLEAPPHDITVLVPDSQDELNAIHRGVFEELVKGKQHVRPETLKLFRESAARLVERGVQALILGTTDLGFVFNEEELPGVLVVDAAKCHALGVAEWILKD